MIGALACLKKEVDAIKADTSPLLAAEDYRKGLVPAMFYRVKFTVYLVSDSVIKQKY